MSTSISDRLRIARMRAGIRFGAEAARLHGWNDNTHRSHENGNRPIPHKWIEIYAKAFKVSESWLEKGVEEKAGQTKRVPILQWSDLPQRRARMSTAVANPSGGRTNTPVPHVAWPPEDDPNSLPVLDDSMVDPTGGRTSFYPGDFLIIEFIAKDGKPKPNSVCLLFDPEDGAHYFRKAEYIDRQTIRFVAANLAFPETTLPANSDHILAVVVGVTRRFG